MTGGTGFRGTKPERRKSHRKRVVWSHSVNVIPGLSLSYLVLRCASNIEGGYTTALTPGSFLVFCEQTVPGGVHARQRGLL